MDILKPNMYVRTKYNGISKIVDYINDPTHYFFKCYKLDRNYINCEEYITETDVLKASHNLLGNDEEPCLIEEGDYVNGCKVININGNLYINEDSFKTELQNVEIKSIVTREQFSQMEYKVGD